MLTKNNLFSYQKEESYFRVDLLEQVNLIEIEGNSVPPLTELEKVLLEERFVKASGIILNCPEIESSFPLLFAGEKLRHQKVAFILHSSTEVKFSPKPGWFLCKGEFPKAYISAIGILANEKYEFPLAEEEIEDYRPFSVDISLTKIEDVL